MTNFNRGGEGMSCGQSDHVNVLSRSEFGTGSRYHDLSSRPININDRLLSRNKFGTGIPSFLSDVSHESKQDLSIQNTSTLYHLSSAQDLPWFYLCSASARSARERAVTRLRSFIGAPSQSHRSAIEASSEKGRTWLVLGRYQVGSLFVSCSPLVRAMFGKFLSNPYQFSIDSLSFAYVNSRRRIEKPKVEDIETPKLMRSSPEAARNKARIKPRSSKSSAFSSLWKSSRHVFSFNTLLIHCYYFENAWVMLRQYTKNASAKLAEGIDSISGLGRACLQSCSTAVRQLFRSCSAASRSAVEAGSNITRRSVEGVPNPSRSGVEGESKSSRRQVEAEAKGSLAKTCLCTGYEQEMPKNGTRNVQDWHKDETRTEQETPKNGTRIALETIKDDTTKWRREGEGDCFGVVPHLPDSRDTHKDGEVVLGVVKLSERYCKGTGKVLNSGGKGTGEVLESYQRGTKEVLTGSRSVVALERDGGESQVASSTDDTSITVDDLCMNRLILRSFRAPCEEFRGEVESMVVKRNRGRQIALKELIGFKVKSKPFAYSLQLMAIILCVFSFPDLLGARVLAQTPQQRAVSRLSRESGINFGDKQEFVRDIRGTVIDAVTKKPLDGAYMYIYLDTAQSSYAARRSSNGGKFDFKGAHLQKGILRIYHKGYVTRNIEISTSKNGPYRVEMQPETVIIDEVEVISTGYFSIPKERATGSFTHVNNELLSRSVGSNVIDRLKDVVPGLTFNQQQIGKSRIVNEPAISIRGRSTINGNAAPLIVLDNFPYEGDINDINPEDIASVTVLQDAAAASIWGARAGNGVIVLNSKKGTLERALRTSVRADYSVSAKPDLYYTPTMSMSDFVEVERFLFHKNAWNAYINQGYSYITPAVELLKQHRDKKLSDAELEAGLDVLKGQDVRHDLDRYFYRPSSLRKVSASFDGGGKANTYYFSVGYDQNVGTQQGADNKRLSLNARNSYQLWDNKLRFDMGLLFSKSQQGYTLMSGNQYNVLYDRWADADGNALSIGGGNSFRQSYIDTAGNGLLRDWNYRPLEDLGMNSNRVDDLDYQLNAGVTLKPLPWLSASIQYRYNSGNSRSHAERDAESFYIRNLYNRFAQIDYTNNIVKSAIPNGEQLNSTRSYSDQHNGRFQLDVNHSWGIHQVALLGGAEVNHYGTGGQVDAALLGYKPNTETYTPIDLSINYRQYATRTSGPLLVSPINPTRESAVNRNILAFANGSYTYDRRYTGTFSVRKDQANIFGVAANERGKPFWSAGILWHLHEEGFMTLPWVQRLSLRATHGAMGNVSTASALLTSAVSSTVDYDSKRVFQRIVNPPNPMLSWEKVGVTNLAVDFAILNRRLEGSVERYFRKSTDLLSYNPMAPTSGVSRLYGNWSSMKSSGWDVTLTSRQIQGDFNWSSTLIFSHIKEVVTSYKEKPSSDRLYLTANIGSYPIEGKPLNTIYSFRYAGLDNSGNPIGYLDGEQSTDYTKIYNNTALSDYIYHGRATPNTFGSLRNNIGYKSVDLSFTLSYHLGYYFRQQAFSSTALYSVLGYGETPFQYQYAERWQQSGDEAKTRIPAALYPINGNRDAFYGMAEDHVQKGDHIRFRDIRLSYSFPELKNKAIKGMQLYVYVDNVGVLWSANDSGYDPQAVPNTGLLFPAPRTFSFGINFNL